MQAFYAVYFNHPVKHADLMRLPGIKTATLAFEDRDYWETEYCWALVFERKIDMICQLRMRVMGMVEYFYGDDARDVLHSVRVWKKKSKRSNL